MQENKLYLEKELLFKRNKFKTESAILEEVKIILAKNDFDRNQISEKLKEQSSTKVNQLEYDLLQPEKIFNIAQITLFQQKP